MRSCCVHLHGYKFTRALTSDQERGSVPAANINTVQSSPVLVWRTVLGLCRYLVMFRSTAGSVLGSSEQHRGCQTQSGALVSGSVADFRTLANARSSHTCGFTLTCPRVSPALFFPL
ncbi:hypothetical protein DPX16_8366 [Anabarilius grahami]|uniref:Uncharacterized protein n=1 Tax=Anabarilius grahami TaxID=495550 RepID=A0A3N0ZC10_ANAGA|nr:hypothetical protein DPX16_8366 [Anabarilius grahami]